MVVSLCCVERCLTLCGPVVVLLYSVVVFYWTLAVSYHPGWCSLLCNLVSSVCVVLAPFLVPRPSSSDVVSYSPSLLAAVALSNFYLLMGILSFSRSPPESYVFLLMAILKEAENDWRPFWHSRSEISGFVWIKSRQIVTSVVTWYIRNPKSSISHIKKDSPHSQSVPCLGLLPSLCLLLNLRTFIVALLCLTFVLSFVLLTRENISFWYVSC